MLSRRSSSCAGAASRLNALMGWPRSMASGGPDAITLRAIAREMGMTANAIYGYFATRDDLVTTLINDVYTALADAVDAAWEAAPVTDPAIRITAWATAFRTWAVVNPQ